MLEFVDFGIMTEFVEFGTLLEFAEFCTLSQFAIFGTMLDLEVWFFVSLTLVLGNIQGKNQYIERFGILSDFEALIWLFDCFSHYFEGLLKCKFGTMKVC